MWQETMDLCLSVRGAYFDKEKRLLMGVVMIILIEQTMCFCVCNFFFKILRDRLMYFFPKLPTAMTSYSNKLLQLFSVAIELNFHSTSFSDHLKALLSHMNSDLIVTQTAFVYKKEVFNLLWKRWASLNNLILVQLREQFTTAAKGIILKLPHASPCKKKIECQNSKNP